MNIVLWILQILLALWNVIGGFFILHNYEKIANERALSALPTPLWIALGVLQILLALGLLLPGTRFSKPISIAAALLAIVSLLGIELYTQYAGFPGMLWGVIPALLAGFVAFKRWSTLPATKE